MGLREKASGTSLILLFGCKVVFKNAEGVDYLLHPIDDCGNNGQDRKMLKARQFKSILHLWTTQVIVSISSVYLDSASDRKWDPACTSVHPSLVFC